MYFKNSSSIRLPNSTQILESQNNTWNYLSQAAKYLFTCRVHSVQTLFKFGDL